MRPLQSSVRAERLSGCLILAAIILAMLAANSPFAALYNAIHHAPMHFGIEPFVLREPLIELINEGLLVLFFLLVGLEIKGEILGGRLSSVRLAALPAIAALGGMLVPAAIYITSTWPDAILMQGWAVPMATDIVLAIGILSLLGDRAPQGAKTFLLALAIFDDIGAVLVIAAFYAGELAVPALVLVVASLTALGILNRVRRVHRGAFFGLAVILWISMLEAGLEAALAGILIAIMVPTGPTSPGASSPLKVLERRLRPVTMLVIVPLFAFFNAGIEIDSGTADRLAGPVSLGIIAGLVLGKPLGVFSATWLALKAGLGRLPEGMRRLHLIGVALLAGAGFTMSLFIATLAYADPNTLAAAKLAVVIGSFASIVAATCLLIAGGRIDDSIGEDGPPDMDAVKHRSGPGERLGAAPE